MAGYEPSERFVMSWNIYISICTLTVIGHIILGFFIPVYFVIVSFVVQLPLFVFSFMAIRHYKKNKVAIEFGRATEGIYSEEFKELRYQHEALAEIMRHIASDLSRLREAERLTKQVSIDELHQFLLFAFALHTRSGVIEIVYEPELNSNDVEEEELDTHDDESDVILLLPVDDVGEKVEVVENKPEKSNETVQETEELDEESDDQVVVLSNVVVESPGIPKAVHRHLKQEVDKWEQ